MSKRMEGPRDRPGVHVWSMRLLVEAGIALVIAGLSIPPLTQVPVEPPALLQPQLGASRLVGRTTSCWEKDVF